MTAPALSRRATLGAMLAALTCGAAGCANYRFGTNTLYAGGERESFLLLPVIPRAD